jgi:CheY-like chemotaxis protein
MRKPILYVDDSECTRELLKTIFEDNHPGYEIVLHKTADDALSDLQARRDTPEFPVTVVTDLHLSFRGDDGLRLVQQIRTRFPSLPLILVSGIVRPSDLERSRACGADTIVEKDMNMQTFASRLFDLIHRQPGSPCPVAGFNLS